MTQVYYGDESVRRQDVWDALKQLAPRRPADPSSPDGDVRWERVDVDRYRVVSAGCPVGFVEVVGAVFVVLSGDRYDRAVEVAQTLLFERAVDVLVPKARLGVDAATSD
jgi:hypothetical protein